MLKDIARKVQENQRLTPEEALYLFQTEDIFTLGELASLAKERRFGKRVFYVRNVHINPTNICVNRCRFCAFSRSEGQEGAYEMSPEEVLQALRQAGEFDELHMVGGLHPRWGLGHYIALLRAVREAFPSVCIKAFTATEVEYLARKEGLSLKEVLLALKEAGLGLLPGGGAEIFAPEIRARLCPEKLGAQGWLQVMRTAHQAGLKSNATMLYGHLEGPEHRVQHLQALRSLQDETQGFLAFIPLPYVNPGGAGPGGLEALRCIAVARLFLDNFPHIKAYWVMLGEKLSQLALLFGADDLEGTVVSERIAHSAGATTPQALTEDELRHLIAEAGMVPTRRDSFYRALQPQETRPLEESSA